MYEYVGQFPALSDKSLFIFSKDGEEKMIPRGFPTNRFTVKIK